MASISIASAKGGCGKTTVAILLGTELAQDGYKVTLLDCDLNQHATAFGVKAEIVIAHVPDLIVATRRWAGAVH
jgi:chromosome partitioning protein